MSDTQVPSLADVLTELQLTESAMAPAPWWAKIHTDPPYYTDVYSTYDWLAGVQTGVDADGIARMRNAFPALLRLAQVAEAFCRCDEMGNDREANTTRTLHRFDEVFEELRAAVRGK